MLRRHMGGNYCEGAHAAEADIEPAMRWAAHHLPPEVDTPFGGIVDDAIQHFSQDEQPAPVLPSTPSGGMPPDLLVIQ